VYTFFFGFTSNQIADNQTAAIACGRTKMSVVQHMQLLNFDVDRNKVLFESLID